jgi:hypothetical protein
MRADRGDRARWAAVWAFALLGCRVPATVGTDERSPAPIETPTPQPAAPATTTTPTTSAEPPATLEDALERHAVPPDDFVRLELYTWTTAWQIEALRAGGPLLVADAQTGYATPYRRLLAAMERERRPGHALASALQSTPSLSRCRYAWPSPFATVLGLGPTRYGEALVRIRLRPEAVIARLDPTADPPWTLRDGSDRPVAEPELLADPTRLGAVYHLRVDDEPSVRFREYVLCNPAMVESWEVGTPAIAERVAAEQRLVLDLREGPFAALPKAQTRWRAWPQWLERDVPSAWPSRWHRALAFDNARYRPTAADLDALAKALLDYDPTPPAITWPPPEAAAAQASR